MIPKNKDPFDNIKPLIEIAHRYINKEYYCDEEEVARWQKALDENKEQRHKDFCKAYADMEKSNAKLKEALKSRGKV